MGAVQVTDARNPLLDPIPGDEVEVRQGQFYLVQVARAGKVGYHTRVGPQWLNGTMRCTLVEWRDLVKAGKTVKRAV